VTVAAKTQAEGGEPVAWENPLIPNKKLRALYVAMLELRLLDEFAGKFQGWDAVCGEEGCRVSTTFDLKPGDLTSEVTNGAATGFLRGIKLADVVHRSKSSGKGRAAAGRIDHAGQIPAMVEALDQLHLALGAATALKATKKGALVIAYVHYDEVTRTEWKPVLRFAAQNVLPVIFVVLAGDSTRGLGQLSLAANKCGLPGIPVDAADPVALYRVAQESMLRGRAGGGPVLMECVPFHIAARTSAPADPVHTMQEFLLHRRIVDEAWLRGVESKFKSRLEATGQ
jgi:TPP-dependent pyruvate/acetoin dehydrogenase alpha subunit